MRQNKRFLIAMGLALVLLPGAVDAAGDRDGKNGLSAGLQTWLSSHWQGHEEDEVKPESENDESDTHMMRRLVNGTVTAVGNQSFDLRTADGTVYTVATADAKIQAVFSGPIALSQIAVNDTAKVNGDIDGTTIAAKLVLITPANTHPASARGTVTAVKGDQLTLQINTHGVISEVPVIVSSDTQVYRTGTTTTTTAASITVGAQVKIKGLWDEILNVLKAFKVRIFSML